MHSSKSHPMQKLFVSPMLVEVESFKEVLEQEGITCMIKNQQGSSLAGEVPFAEVFPELWVINDNDYSDAQEILENWEQVQHTTATDWTCSKCQETLEGDFTTCWKCGEVRKLN